MKERVKQFACMALCAWMPAPTVMLLVQKLPDVDPRLTCGHVVRDTDGSPAQGVTVEAFGFRVRSLPVMTDESGAFELHDGPRCSQSGATENRGIDYLRLSGPGYAVALVDPCADAPWANPVRVRASAVLTGTLGGASKGRWITVSAPESELIWPPRSGLTCEEKSWRAQADVDGQFEINDLPAQVPLSVRINGFNSDEGPEFTVVLAPDERRKIEAPTDEAQSVRTDNPGPNALWIPVDASVSTKSGSLNLPWIEFVHGGRFVRHFVGGGRWHVHHHRACEHLEITPGPSTLVARDADGRIGAVDLEVRATDKLARPSVSIAPGALLRIDASALPARARLTLAASGVTFVDVELIPGTVRYEVVPAATVQMRVAIMGGEAHVRDIEAAAGKSLDIKL